MSTVVNWYSHASYSVSRTPKSVSLTILYIYTYTGIPCFLVLCFIILHGCHFFLQIEGTTLHRQKGWDLLYCDTLLRRSGTDPALALMDASTALFQRSAPPIRTHIRTVYPISGDLRLSRNPLLRSHLQYLRTNLKKTPKNTIPENKDLALCFQEDHALDIRTREHSPGPWAAALKLPLPLRQPHAFLPE